MRIRSSISAALLLATAIGASAGPKPQLNVLFVAVDDWKPLGGLYDDKIIRTPHLDALARRGTTFTRAYCMQAVCAPSRNSVLTGLRPTTLQIYDLGTFFRRRAPDVVTLPQLFKQHGYQTLSIGKIFHPYHGNQDDARSWTLPSEEDHTVYALPENQALDRENRKRKSPPTRGPATETGDLADDTYQDGQIANRAIRRLREFKDKQEPFFLALGFHLPHLPFAAPKRYWDIYRDAAFPQPRHAEPPSGAPGFAPTRWEELRSYYDIPATGPLPPSQVQHLIHGYYAATSYMDAQLGRVLKELEELGLTESTIIVVWGDHGFHLGDHGMWCKHTVYEQATRAPLIIAAPGQTGGQTANGLVEFVDIYPTVAALAGLALPGYLEGDDLRPLLRNPRKAVKSAAFQVYPREVPPYGQLLGQAVRTDRWRYVEWQSPKGEIVARELYDLRDDPGETRNLADNRRQESVVAKHHQLLTRRLAAPPPVGLRLLAEPSAGAKPAN